MKNFIKCTLALFILGTFGVVSYYMVTEKMHPIKGSLKISSGLDYKLSHIIHGLSSQFQNSTWAKKISGLFTHESTQPEPTEDTSTTATDIANNHLLTYYMKDIETFVSRLRASTNTINMEKEFSAFSIKSEQILQPLRGDKGLFETLIYKISEITDENLAAIVILSVSKGQSSALSGHAVEMLDEGQDESISLLLNAFLNYAMLNTEQSKDQLYYHLESIESIAEVYDPLQPTQQKTTNQQPYIPQRLKYAAALLGSYTQGILNPSSVSNGTPTTANAHANTANLSTSVLLNQALAKKQAQHQAHHLASSSSLGGSPYSSPQTIAITSSNPSGADCLRTHRAIEILSSISSDFSSDEMREKLEESGC